MASKRFRAVFVRCVAVALAVTASLAIVASVQAYIRVGNAETTARTQLAAVSADLARAADSMQTASDAIANGSTTASNAQSAIASAATIVQSAATGADNAGNVAGFTIPFTKRQPLGNAEDALKNQAAQISALADSLNRTATSVGTNAADLRVIAANVADTATRLREASRSVAQFANTDANDGGLARISAAARSVAVISAILGVLIIAVAASLWLLAPSGEALAEAPVTATARESDRAQRAATPPEMPETSEALPTA
jgi:hypothetical protein